MTITLSVTSSGNFRITGDVDALMRNKRARLLLRSQLPYEKVEDELVIASNGMTTSEVNNILKLAAEYIGAEVDYDTVISTGLADFKRDEELFEEFSRKAENIRNNHCDVTDFKHFEEILDEHMTHRHLYALQMLSAYHLAFSQNACNFSVPGAGKTSIVYGAYTYLKNLPKDNPKHVDRILIVGPLSSFGPWESEYAECFGCKTTCQRIGGMMPLEKKKEYFCSGKAELTLISYQSIASVVDDVRFFLKQDRVMLVLDEAHKIKNTSGGVQARSIMSLAAFAASRVVLTGTPAPNGYEDIYNLFHFIWPDHDVISYTVGQLRDMSKNKEDHRVDRLMDNISPYFIRIRKSDLHLPPATENPPIIVPMKESQRKIYDYIEQRFVEEAMNNPVDHYFKSVLVKAKMIRLQQASTNPALLRVPLMQSAAEYDLDLSLCSVRDSAIMSEVMKFYRDETPAKFDACLNLVKKLIDKGEKVIIWAMFIGNIESLSKFLTQNGINNRILYGATPVATDEMDDEERERTREGIVKQFHDLNCPYKVIIANAFAVAESISLHKACHNAIYLERSFNCAHYMQSKDRIHRYGLANDVVTNYYYLLSEESVDETVDTRLRLKESRMLEIIESMPIPLFVNVTDEGDDDIKAILSDYVKRKARQSK